MRGVFDIALHAFAVHRNHFIRLIEWRRNRDSRYLTGKRAEFPHPDIKNCVE
jgi:hypothetical protein